MGQEKTAVDKEWPLQPKFCSFIELQKKIKNKIKNFIILLSTNKTVHMTNFWFQGPQLDRQPGIEAL